MGVFKVFSRFIFTLYSLVLCWVVWINLASFCGYDIFSGGPSATFVGQNTFENSYFGFSSIINAIADFPADDQFGQWLKIISALKDSFSGGAAKLGASWSGWQNGNIFSAVIDAVTGIFDILIAPIETVIATFASIVWLLNFAINILWWIGRLFGGYYNIPLRTM